MYRHTPRTKHRSSRDPVPPLLQRPSYPHPHPPQTYATVYSGSTQTQNAHYDVREVRPRTTQMHYSFRRKKHTDGSKSHHVHFEIPLTIQKHRTTSKQEQRKPRERDHHRERNCDRKLDETLLVHHPEPSHPPTRHHSTTYAITKPPSRPYTKPRNHSPPPASSSIPTIYILSFSTDLVPDSTALTKFLDKHLPKRTHPIPHLYTIDVSNIPPPPSHICTHYSGVSSTVQSYVLPDRRAKAAISHAVNELLEFRRQEARKERENRKRRESGRGTFLGFGKPKEERVRLEVAMSVCCVAGTHRSVAVAEGIAKKVREEVNGKHGGVRVVVKHVHRMKGVWDPY